MLLKWPLQLLSQLLLLLALLPLLLLKLLLMDTTLTLIGVAAVDLPMCELTAAAEAAGWTDDVADPSEVLTRQGCACADSYTYEGRTYTGCTTYDWATAWCGTVDSDCGICDEQVQGGGGRSTPVPRGVVLDVEEELPVRARRRALGEPVLPQPCPML